MGRKILRMLFDSDNWFLATSSDLPQDPWILGFLVVS